MITGLVDLIMGGGLQLALLLLGLLPSVDVASLPLAVLASLNWFVPIGDLLTILSVWIGLVLSVNVAMAVQRLIASMGG